jgi:SAM-dependent methyltransferase
MASHGLRGAGTIPPTQGGNRVTYTLSLSDEEVARYRDMAEAARTQEGEAWRAAGVVPGARVADVGCGPGLVLCELARAVSPGGDVIGVEQNPGTVDAAAAIIEREGLSNARVVVGEASSTGLAPSSFDVVMMRHVLAHNGGREQQIVDHLASLLRTGGSIYLVDVDVTAIRAVPPAEPELDELTEAYRELHGRLGNDLSVGTRLSHLLDSAGLEVTDREGRYQIMERTGDMRGPMWAARAALIAAGLATEQDFVRWETAFRRDVAAPGLKLLYVPVFRATGRRPKA